VEAPLARSVRAGGRALDPFRGLRHGLVQALESGHDATGVDVAAFNVLLIRVKTARYNLSTLERELRDASTRLERGEVDAVGQPSEYMRRWFAPQASADLLGFRSLIADYEHADVLRVVLARAARSARRTTPFDLDFPRAPQRGPYWCHKHRRECRPVDRADHFLRRYALDTVARVKAFARVRASGRSTTALHGDARNLDPGRAYDAVLTSPPYPGLIDYHEQHRYAYELLGLEQLGTQELGRGSTKRAIQEYIEGVALVLERSAERVRRGGRVLVVVNDRRDLYPAILGRAGLQLEHRLRRHVNRCTGRRAGEYFEDLLVGHNLSHS
jgi:hypothetical protein